jgi:SOS response regulatory protein OraA/RecX
MQESDKKNKEIEISAYSSSLNYDENTWDILNQEVAKGGFKSSNKREDLDVKIADRHLVQQRGFNPFLSEHDYADDVSVRDQYLKPQNTTQDVPNT